MKNRFVSMSIIAVLLFSIIALINANGCSKKSSSKDTVVASSATYPAPTVSAISPSSGYNDLNTPVQITGTNFASGVTVKIGTTSATTVTCK